MMVEVLGFNKDKVRYLKGVNQIKVCMYREPKGDGDRHYIDVYYNDNTKVRYFNPDEILFAEGLEDE